MMRFIIKDFVGTLRSGCEMEMKPQGCEIEMKPQGCEIEMKPQGWVTSREAGELLGVATRGARAYLHRRRVVHKYYMCEVSGRREVALCWPEGEVRRLSNAKGDVLNRLPTGYCLASEAVELLGVARSRLWRMEKSGEIEGRKVRVRMGRVTRSVTIYKRSHVRGLARKKACMQLQAANARLARLEELSRRAAKSRMALAAGRRE